MTAWFVAGWAERLGFGPVGVAQGSEGAHPGLWASGGGVCFGVGSCSLTLDSD